MRLFIDLCSFRSFFFDIRVFSSCISIIWLIEFDCLHNCWLLLCESISLLMKREVRCQLSCCYNDDQDACWIISLFCNIFISLNNQLIVLLCRCCSYALAHFIMHYSFVAIFCFVFVCVHMSLPYKHFVVVLHFNSSSFICAILFTIINHFVSNVLSFRCLVMVLHCSVFIVWLLLLWLSF